ncbi:MAG: hypothetical protein IJI38_02790 [Clostridia bacterium]|nr:hypothetical protein [Clostridia bacterium]
METRTIQTGWKVYGILGIVFLILGSVFLIVGIALHFADALNPVGQSVALSVVCFVFTLLGLCFGMLGGIFLMKDLNRKRNERRAFEGGYCVKGRIAGFVERREVTINGRHPITVECHVEDLDSRTLHVYESKYLYFIPDTKLIGQEVDIYLDRMNDKAYYVDIDSLIPRVVRHTS